MINKLCIKTKADYLKLERHIYDKNIPSNPQKFYNEWESWSLFLRNEIYKKKQNNLYHTYSKCKNIIQKFNIETKEEWFANINELNKNDVGIPYDPRSVYKDDWVNWGEFLGNNNKINSYGEKMIMKILDELGVIYIYNKSFRDCKYVNKLRFDFRIEINGKIILIEYDGIQHFREISKYGGINGFNETLLRDAAKNEWCAYNSDVILVRFNHKQSFKEIRNNIIVLIKKYA